MSTLKFFQYFVLAGGRKKRGKIFPLSHFNLNKFQASVKSTRCFDSLQNSDEISGSYTNGV